MGGRRWGGRIICRNRWVSSDSGREGEEHRQLDQQIRESTGSPVVTFREYASPNHTSASDHTRDSEDL